MMFPHDEPSSNPDVSSVRHTKETWPTETCRACGYALRGLPSRGHCPECGEPYPPEKSFLAVHRFVALDAPEILRADGMDSVPWRLGLLFCLLATAGSLVMQVVPALTSHVNTDYDLTMAGLAVLWSVGLLLAIPGQSVSQMTWFRWWRRLALGSQFLWIPVFALDSVFVGQPLGFLRVAMTIVLLSAVLLAGAGLMMTLALLATIARDIDLRRTASRLRLCVLLFPVWGGMVWLADYPSQPLSNIPPGPLGPVVRVVVIGLLIPWWVLFLIVLHAFGQMYNQSQWAVRVARSAEGRAERIREKRAAATSPHSSTDDQRRLGESSADIPLEDGREPAPSRDK